MVVCKSIVTIICGAFWVYYPTHMQGVKQLVCPSIVVIGTKVIKSQVLSIYACCKHNQSVDISEKLVSTHFKLLKIWLTSATNCAFSVQHTCGLSTIPTLLACIDATAHARAQCRKWWSSHNSSDLSAVECCNTTP